MVGGLPDWIRLWCVMRQHHLRCWTYPEDVGRRMPIHSFDLTEVQGEGKVLLCACSLLFSTGPAIYAELNALITQ